MSGKGPRIPWTVGLAAATAVPLIVMGFDRGRGQFDQEFFHEPAIRTFAHDWPAFDFVHYLSATTPGYHLLMAAAVRYITSELFVLKLLGLVFGLALLWVLERTVHRALASKADIGRGAWAQRHGLLSAALCLPVACSSYVYMSNVWLLPDNAGWLGVLLCALIGLRLAGGFGRQGFDETRDRWGLGIWVGAMFTITALLWVRQSHLWAAGVVCAGAWLSVGDVLAGAGGRFGPTKIRMRRLALAALAAIPAVLCLLYFKNKWGGLTPPGFKEQLGSGPNPAMPALVLSLFGVFGIFFAPWWWAGLMRLARTSAGRCVLGAALLVAVALAVGPETTHSNQGLVRPRDTGLWLLVKKVGMTLGGHTSPVILGLAPMGACVLAGGLARQRRRTGWLLAAAIIGFTLAASASALAWQRYVEPFILIALALLSAGAVVRPRPVQSTFYILWKWGGPLALSLLLTVQTVVTLVRSEKPVKTWTDPVRLDPAESFEPDQRPAGSLVAALFTDAIDR